DMQVSRDCVVDSEPWVPFAASVPVTLPAGDGTKTVCVQYRNNALMTSGSISDTIQLDTVAPAGRPLVAAFQIGLTGRIVNWAAQDPAPSGGGPFVFDVQRKLGINSLGSFVDLVTGTSAASRTFAGL